MQKSSFGRAISDPAAPDAKPDPNDRRKGDRRTASRSHTILKGKLSYRHGTYTLDCTIRDKSETGARIRIPSGHMIPDELYLVDLLNRVAYKSSVIWRKADGNIGLHFDETHDLSRAASDDLRHLSEFCDEYSLPGRRLKMP